MPSITYWYCFDNNFISLENIPHSWIRLNDFYSKSNEASQILKEIENSLKEGSRKKVCSRQREAARLGLLANKSLIKAFEIEGANPPMQAIKSSQKRWESILNECWRKPGNL